MHSYKLKYEALGFKQNHHQTACFVKKGRNSISIYKNIFYLQIPIKSFLLKVKFTHGPPSLTSQGLTIELYYTFKPVISNSLSSPGDNSLAMLSLIIEVKLVCCYNMCNQQESTLQAKNKAKDLN